MSFTKINISIPLEIDKKLSELIEKGQKSAFIANCVKERLEILEKEKLDNQLREGYLIQSKEALKIAKDFELTDLEGLEND